jgi:hypothetical protein
VDSARVGLAWLATAVLAVLAGGVPSASAAVSAIAFHRVVTPTGEDAPSMSGVWAMPAGGGEPTLLIRGGLHGRLAPEGGKIGYYGDTGIEVAKIDGSSPTTVLALPENATDFDLGLGNQIALATSTNGGFNANALQVLNADGSGAHTIYTAPATPAGFSLSGPAFSADGAQIVFSQSLFPGVSAAEGLWIVNSDGSNPHQVTAADGSDSRARFAPDGSRIAFTRFLPSNVSGESQGDLFVMNSDGSGATNFTNTAGTHEIGAAFSPDGTRIAYAARPVGSDTAAEHIEIIGPDGSNRVDLTSSLPGPETDPTWANVAALPPPPSSGGGSGEDVAACEKARDRLENAREKLRKLRHTEAPKGAIKRAKHRVNKAKQEVGDAC